jgi:hypothetical protein
LVRFLHQLGWRFHARGDAMQFLLAGAVYLVVAFGVALVAGRFLAAGTRSGEPLDVTDPTRQ